MADRPYRVYRGGQGAPPAPGEPRLDLPGVPPGPDAPPLGERRGPVVLPPPGAPPPRRTAPAGVPAAPRRRHRARRIVLVVGLLVLVALLLWLLLGYLAFRSAVEEANARLDPAARAALTRQTGLLTGAPSNILVLGADRTGNSDTLQVVHTDPGRNLVSTLAIPRDLYVRVPGLEGLQKINAAYATGGPARAIETVEALTGLEINHVVLIDFDGFVELIDAVGGVTVDNPTDVVSTFDGYTYRFGKGPVELSGKRALAYARVRKNELDPTDSDVRRGQRQQQVMRALKAELVSPLTLLRLRSVGSAVAGPLSTDLSANQLLSLGWVDFRAQRELRCNLGGTPQDDGGQLVLEPDRSGNARVLSEFLGRSAVQRVGRDAGPFAPACRGG